MQFSRNNLLIFSNMEASSTLPVTSSGPKILLPPFHLHLRHFPPSPLLPLLPPLSHRLLMLPRPSSLPPLPTWPHPKPHLSLQQVKMQGSTLLNKNKFIHYPGLGTQEKLKSSPTTQTVIKS